jgi:hypothetical protein
MGRRKRRIVFGVWEAIVWVFWLVEEGERPAVEWMDARRDRGGLGGVLEIRDYCCWRDEGMVVGWRCM